MDEIQALRRAYEGALMQLEGVVGVGSGKDDMGKPVLVIYTSQPFQEVTPRLPEALLAKPIRFTFIGHVNAQDAFDKP